jgi:hypothetical protein
VIAGLLREEVQEFLAEATREFPQIEFVGAWGNIFVRDALCMQPRHRLLENPENREKLYAALFGDIDATYTRSSLVQLVKSTAQT